jgi:hypothetical protein
LLLAGEGRTHHVDVCIFNHQQQTKHAICSIHTCINWPSPLAGALPRPISGQAVAALYAKKGKNETAGRLGALSQFTPATSGCHPSRQHYLGLSWQAVAALAVF